ncbi:DUF6906 family protein [Paenibacillus sp. FSL R7-0026]|uniref:DUF6906 family protein n=1 Tax=Paenibacillus sp. FSL R7-0026 TaxID=2921668 RepID=UPI0030FAD84C
MKNGKNPSRRQKQAIAAAKLVPDNWLVYKAEPGSLHIINRNTQSTKIIKS